MKGPKPSITRDRNPVKVLPPPKWMSAEAKKEWKRVMPELVERRILTTADLGSLENYCVATGTVREMNLLLQAEGYTYTTEAGLRKQHPAFSTLAVSMTQARQLGAELGLTPSSRSRPAIRDTADDDSLVD